MPSPTWKSSVQIVCTPDPSTGFTDILRLYVYLDFIVYQKGDIVKQLMKSRDVLPKNVPGVGWGGVGYVM